ncbi:hypothetical protein [Salinarimonas chemoclinalis]|uniref:hypothetical protein n=1 Tax=Salinarimonas chemoclinalis TaxID=3241599 RepID=UPI003557D5CE
MRPASLLAASGDPAGRGPEEAHARVVRQHPRTVLSDDQDAEAGVRLSQDAAQREGEERLDACEIVAARAADERYAERERSSERHDAGETPHVRRGSPIRRAECTCRP